MSKAIGSSNVSATYYHLVSSYEKAALFKNLIVKYFETYCLALVQFIADEFLDFKNLLKSHQNHLHRFESTNHLHPLLSLPLYRNHCLRVAKLVLILLKNEL